MDSEELKNRTKKFAINVINFVPSLKGYMASDVLAKQLLRSATSVGANYRAACRARSKAEFISKIAVVEEEADETIYWLELIKESKLHDLNAVQPLLTEASELTAIFTSSGKTAKKVNPKSNFRNPQKKDK